MSALRRLTHPLFKGDNNSITNTTLTLESILTQRFQSTQALLRTQPPKNHIQNHPPISKPKWTPTPPPPPSPTPLQTIQIQQQNVQNMISSIQRNLKAFNLQSSSSFMNEETKKVGYQVMNRNARKPKKANHGARPCSRYARRMKRKRFGNPKRRG